MKKFHRRLLQAQSRLTETLRKKIVLYLTDSTTLSTATLVRGRGEWAS